MRLLWALPLLIACEKGGDSDSASFASAACPAAGAPAGAELGAAAPDFTLLNGQDEPVSLSSFCGQVVLLAFGTFW